MAQLDNCRIIVDEEPKPGSWNMAVDELLLETALDGGGPTLRVYRWSEPSVSLGYFQDVDRIEPNSMLAGLPVVRRLSGGGAILHHHEWTYSCSLPAHHPTAASPASLYRSVHDRVVALLARHGLNGRLRGKSDGPYREPFLCFGRRDPCDLVVGKHKILGSAQRRRRGALLQHGSLLMRRSPFAPDFLGIADLAPLPACGVELAIQLADEIGLLLGSKLIRSALSRPEQQRARTIQQQRYRSINWGKRGAIVGSYRHHRTAPNFDSVGSRDED
jgi:lipoate-protein ligase A